MAGRLARAEAPPLLEVQPVEPAKAVSLAARVAEVAGRLKNSASTTNCAGGVVSGEGASSGVLSRIIVRYHSGGSMELNAHILLFAHMVYL